MQLNPKNYGRNILPEMPRKCRTPQHLRYHRIQRIALPNQRRQMLQPFPIDHNNHPLNH